MIRASSGSEDADSAHNVLGRFHRPEHHPQILDSRFAKIKGLLEVRSPLTSDWVIGMHEYIIYKREVSPRVTTMQKE